MANKRDKDRVGIACPVCGRGEMNVIETRTGENYIRRRRRCASYSCKGRLTTVEGAYNGRLKFDEGLAVLPRGELLRWHEMLGQVLNATPDDEDESVSPDE